MKEHTCKLPKAETWPLNGFRCPTCETRYIRVHGLTGFTWEER